VIVVSNAGPLIALGKLGQLGLLLKLYGYILIPHEVYHEVVINGLRLGATDAQAVHFLIEQGHIRIVEIALPSPLPPWAESIDIGEIEVITLAQRQSADLVLIDDIRARKAARQVGLPLKGTVGILLAAFRQRYLTLPEFELLMQSIKAQPDLWISTALCDGALAHARQEVRKQS
jgi:predicted nucleic acid-binding protein